MVMYGVMEVEEIGLRCRHSVAFFCFLRDSLNTEKPSYHLAVRE